MAWLQEEPVATQHCLLEIVEERFWHCDRLAAALADQVPVTIFTQVVGGGAVAEMDVLDDTELFELVQIAVDGGTMHRWIQRVDLGDQLVGGAVALPFEQAVQQQPT